MDISSVVGVILAFGLIIGSMMMGSAPMSAFIDIPSALVVIGGAMAACMTCFPLSNILSTPKIMLKVLLKVLLKKPADVKGVIEQLVSLAETARRDGLLALESRMDEVTNAYVKLGIQMAVDGTRPEIIEDIMRTEVDSVATRHQTGKGIMDQLGWFAPAFGMIGTLMGLIMMLSNMSDPSSIGAGMAVALITTLYGAIISNAIFMPFAEKLAYINKQELNSMEIIIRGVMAIQSGENPRVIEQKLTTFLPPKQRPNRDEAA